MLHIYTLEQNTQWDSIVSSFSQYDVYWLSGYVKAFKIHGDGEPLLFFYEGEKTKAINVVMKRDIALDKYFTGKIREETYFDFATPYGYGGWLIEGEHKEGLFREYEQWCQDHGIVSEFVRFHPTIKNHLTVENYYDIIALGNTVALDLSSPEIIWANLTSKNRNVIRKAQKNGVEIFHDRQLDSFNVFHGIYNGTMDKDHADIYYYFDSAFYQSIREDLAEHAQVFYAALGDKVIASAIIIMADGKLNYHLSGSIKEYANLAPSNLLLYAAAVWGSENGYKTFHLGGGVGSGEDGLFKFKKSFYRKDDLPRFHIGRKIMDTTKYNELADMRKEMNSDGFFPRYRTRG